MFIYYFTVIQTEVRLGMGKYTVGLPKGVYTPQEWLRRIQVAAQHVNEMAQNYVRGFTAFATGPAAQAAAQKWGTWINIFFAQGVPGRYAEAILPARQAYKGELIRARGGAVAVAPAPVPA